MAMNARANDMPKDSDPLDDYILVSEAAKRLRVSEETVRRLGREGKVTMVKALARLRVSKASLDAFIKREFKTDQQ